MHLQGEAAMSERFIETDPGGRPVIAGTHVTVEEVLKELAAWGEVHTINPRNKLQKSGIFYAKMQCVTCYFNDMGAGSLCE